MEDYNVLPMDNRAKPIVSIYPMSQIYKRSIWIVPPFRANLGIAEKLAQLGVVPIPLDFLPLDTIDPKKYTNRPYWSSEGKLIAGTVITAADPHLFGLVITNFGCEPSSFILRI